MIRRILLLIITVAALVSPYILFKGIGAIRPDSWLVGEMIEVGRRLKKLTLITETIAESAMDEISRYLSGLKQDPLPLLAFPNGNGRIGLQLMLAPERHPSPYHEVCWPRTGRIWKLRGMGFMVYAQRDAIPSLGLRAFLGCGVARDVLQIVLPWWFVLLVTWPYPALCLIIRPWRRRRRRREGHCPKCGYNLKGNVSGVCPECGRPPAKSEIPTEIPS